MAAKLAKPELPEPSKNSQPAERRCTRIWKRLPDDLEAYCWPLSGSPGEKIDFYVSSKAEYSIKFIKLQTDDDGGIGKISIVPPKIEKLETTHSHKGLGNLINEKAPWEGCNWQPSFSASIPPEWASGYYGVLLTSGSDTFLVVFIVGPGEKTSATAVLANVNTWNAYNEWGGASNYTVPNGPNLGFLRPNPGAFPAEHLNKVNKKRGSHLASAEIWLTDYLSLPSVNCKYDLFTDIDLHFGKLDLSKYRTLIVHTHPEYWSMQMRVSLEYAISRGLYLAYLGGNGFYERVVYVEPTGAVAREGRKARTLQFRCGSHDDRSGYSLEYWTKPSYDVTGVYFQPGSYTVRPAPYKILREKVSTDKADVLSGIDPKAYFGCYGRNIGVDEYGGAAGWEIDSWPWYNRDVGRMDRAPFYNILAYGCSSIPSFFTR